MADTEKVKELAGRLFDLVKKRSGNFVDDHEDARAFLENRTTRLAVLTLDLAAAPIGAARDRVLDSINLVEETIDTELLAIANNAVPEAKATFKEAMKVIFGFAKEVLPTLLPMIL